MANRSTRTRGLGLLIACLVLIAPAANAATYPERPPSTNWFVDLAGIMDPAAREAVNATALELFSETQLPIFVVTISSLASQNAEGMTIERYARGLFDYWGIGSQELNYGMLLVVSLNDRKARIELGANWGGREDAAARRVMQELIVPAFKRDDYSVGIVDGVRGMDAMARGLGLPAPTAPWWYLPTMIAGGIGFVALVINLFRSGRKGWAWALIAFAGLLLFFFLRSGGSGGSSGAFGGGSGGGGGATGSW